MNSFLNKLKSVFNKETFEKIKVFCVENKRYFGALALFVILVLVLYNFTGEKPENDGKLADTQKPEEVNTDEFSFDSEFENDSDDAIKALLEKYYEAYAAGDTDELEKIATPISDNEKSYIAVLSKYYEKIMNITYYSKSGAAEGSYFVSVRNDIKFYDIDSTAPALDFFYIETKDDKLYINNLYSIYNLTFAENAMDSDIYTLIQQYMQQDDFEELQGKVQVAYDEALTGDEKLSKMLQETIDTAVREWAATIRPVAESSTEESTEKGTEESTEKDTEKGTEESTEKDTEKGTEESTEKDTEKDTEEPTQTTSKVRTIDIVNVRAGASADAELLGKLTDGVVLTKLGEEGEWTIVEYSGGKDGKGYIKTEFLEAVK